MDYSTLSLYYEILEKAGEEEKAKKILAKLQALENDEFMVIETIDPVEEEDLLEKMKEATENGEEETRYIEIEEEAAPLIPTFMEATNEFIASKLGVDLDAESALEKRIHAFQALQSDLVQNYLEESKKSRKILNRALYVLNSWNELPLSQRQGVGGSNDLISQLLLGEQLRRDSGGFFIRWDECGIVINPGPNFLENFHSRGLFLKDITHVIVTKEAPEAYTDVKRIYDLNYQLNKINPELKVIHYYLNHKAHKELSHVLKPNFKQERNTVHSLELFLDSPDVETEELSKGVTLNFFGTAAKGGFSPGADFKAASKGSATHSLGIRLDLTGVGRETLRIGYISGMPWTPMLAHHLGRCGLLIAGFGNTNPNDYGKLSYNESTLGYFGTYTLLEEVKPDLLLCTEFDGREGDIRLEVAKKMRKEYQTTSAVTSKNIPAILPADKGLFVDLDSLRLECSISGTLFEPKDILVVKTNDTFGGLRYMSPKCLL